MDKGHRRFTPRFVILLVVTLFVGVILYLSYQNAIDRFKDFRITIDNQSAYELTGIQSGLIGSENANVMGKSLFIPGQDLPSGHKIQFTPQLKLSGEGSIYLKFSDSRGNNYTKTVCGYTEYLAGHTRVTVTNDTISVNEECS
ncbi:hypothetical protein [Paenibacillus sp. MER 99-2]|uniref:hypothetical protein n=1 Tax=Paenibacillus sp. MER 99-2 TaxID=2939572 RepID=UPI00204205C9|nr:hypothetical protein [Paenibacillus sp. MER 99-2]MCM3174090.1 hypothetical protein [Paenibacillus sp. MER 99-2]